MSGNLPRFLRMPCTTDEARALLKRLFDLGLSLLGLVVLAPLFLIIGSLVFICDGRPVLFSQHRVGKSGSKFRLVKFRTMKEPHGSGNGLFEPGNNSRVTSVGKFLRKTKLDELPQLINVLKGDMSFVGPRPEVEKWTAYYPEKWEKVLTVKPGITDQASIEFRNEEEILSESADPESTYLNVILPRKLDLCIEYVDNHTFRGDLRLILLTIGSIIGIK